MELIVAIAGTIVGLVISEMFLSRSASNDLRKEAKKDREDLLQITKNIENTMKEIQQEIRGFHYRLIVMEDRSKQKNLEN